MTSFFKAFALFIAVACFVWVGVLWRWQSTQHDMSVEDIAMYLVALPVALFVLVLVGRWAWNGATAPAAPNPAAAAPAAAPVAPAADEAERRATVQLLTAQVNCAAGSECAAVLAALAEGQPRPALDPELRDDDGLPLMTARIPGLDPEAADTTEAEAGVQARQPEWAREELRPEARRALAALLPPLEAALGALQPWRERFGLDDRPPDHVSTSMLRVQPIWPPGWTPYETAVAHAWLQAQLHAAQLAAPARIAFVPPVPAAPGGPWPEAERLLRLLDREGRADVLLLTACHSAIGTASVQWLQAEGRLFTSRTPRLPIAGEAAAVLALAPPQFPPAPDQDLPPVRLHRAAVGLRDKPVDAAGRTASAQAEACIDQALATGPFAADSIAAAVHDADQHTNRAAEALTALLQRQPHLQAGEDIHQTGALTGQAGVAAPLLVLALAAQRAQALEKPCLALSVDDARLRLACVARPASFDPAAPPPAAAA